MKVTHILSYRFRPQQEEVRSHIRVRGLDLPWTGFTLPWTGVVRVLRLYGQDGPPVEVSRSAYGTWDSPDVPLIFPLELHPAVTYEVRADASTSGDPGSDEAEGSSGRL